MPGILAARHRPLTLAEQHLPLALLSGDFATRQFIDRYCTQRISAAGGGGGQRAGRHRRDRAARAARHAAAGRHCA